MASKTIALARCPRCSCELEIVARGAAPANDTGTETLDEWVVRWWREDRARRVSRPEDEQRTYENWIQPHLGARAIGSITRADLEAWVEYLDERVIGGTITWGTAVRIWGVLSKALRDASTSKVRSLRVRAENPAADVRGPDRGSMRAATFLYPSEFLALAGCAAVPLDRRRLYAVAIYLYPRAGELRPLEWGDVDTESGRIHIHRSEDRGGDLGRTKTDADRQFIAEPEILPLLRAMRREGDGHGRVFRAIPQRHNLARALRGHLLEADCQREDLHADDAGRRPLTFHDLRATGITWMAMRGDAPTDILERVGHAHLSTTERYIRRGRLLARASGEVPFPAIPEVLVA